MYYKELLRVRKGFTICVLILIGIAILFSVFGSGGHIRVEGAAKPGDLVPVAVIFAFASIAAAILGTIFGTGLSQENDGHLEIAWTMPASRTRYALTTMAIDLIAVFAVFLIASGLALGTAHVLHIDRYIAYPAGTWAQFLRFLIYPFAWYGLAQALTASVRSHGGAYAGFAWPAGFILFALYGAPLAPELHGLVRMLNLINPVAYATVSVGSDSVGFINPALPATAVALIASGALLALGVAGSAAALFQWRRLEA
ncbi:MAG: hypothetical protein M3Z37_06105 [Candidatus Eremiobacteraeota bacterium]|nr:hypothetical protein [Candidatus Eremiobacteraeota bacterium]